MKALKKGKEKASAERCVRLLENSDAVVRKAAVRTLIEMKPDEMIRRKIAETAVKFPYARLEAVCFFAAGRYC